MTDELRDLKARVEAIEGFAALICCGLIGWSTAAILERLGLVDIAVAICLSLAIGWALWFFIVDPIWQDRKAKRREQLASRQQQLNCPWDETNTAAFSRYMGL